jgi:hypothetical protein
MAAARVHLVKVTQAAQVRALEQVAAVEQVQWAAMAQYLLAQVALDWHLQSQAHLSFVRVAEADMEAQAAQGAVREVLEGAAQAVIAAADQQAQLTRAAAVAEVVLQAQARLADQAIWPYATLDLNA